MLYHFSRQRPHKYDPTAESVGIVRQILLVCQRHMLPVYQRLTLERLQTAVAGNTAAVCVSQYLVSLLATFSGEVADFLRTRGKFGLTYAR